MKTLILDATIVNEGERFVGSVLVEDGFIAEVSRGSVPDTQVDRVVDAYGAYLLPGVIDDHVHMREPGMTHKANMQTETAAAVAGGVTSVLDMPNVVPQTTTNALLEERYGMAEGRCHANYAFFLGATNDNLDEVQRVDTKRTPGVKVFMGSSTGNMLVDNEQRLHELFLKSPTLLMAHCEDTTRINENAERLRALYGEDLEVTYHPAIRDTEACLRSTKLAVALAEETQARLHVAHLTTAAELDLFRADDTHVTAEACVAHLLYTDADYARLGTRIKCNPAVKTAEDRAALRRALTDGRIRVVGTDHAPHLLREKEGGALRAVSGMPMVQFSLPSMLGLADEGVLSIERVVELMCHAPATLFNIRARGFIRPGYHADLCLVRREPWDVTSDRILSLCGWSPREGDTLNWRVTNTWVNGQMVWNGEQVAAMAAGEALEFL